LEAPGPKPSSIKATYLVGGKKEEKKKEKRKKASKKERILSCQKTL
jgi:hypothetical protein